jgi:hypothetical protein
VQQQQNRYLKKFKNKSIKKCCLTFISSSGDSFLMSSTREDWSELAVAAGGVDLLPMTTRIRFCCSPTRNNIYCQPDTTRLTLQTVLGQRLLQLIITLTHNYRPGHKNKHGSDPTAYIKKKVTQSVLLFYFELYITNFQLSL